MKMSGIKHLLPFFQKPIRFKIIVGANFGITEPEALSILYDYTSTGRINGYLNKLTSKTNFHPKMYLVRSGNSGHILIGSANLTNGGFEENNECSLYHRCSVTDQIWMDALTYFDTSILPENADLLNNRIISIYRQYHKKQKKINQQSEPFPDADNNLLYDLKNLKGYLNKQDRLKLQADFNAKEVHYTEARKILEIIRTKTLTPKAFRTYLEDLVGKSGQLGLWYSHGMLRHKTEIFKQQEGFRQLLRSIHGNLHKSPAFIYDEAKKITKSIAGVGPNFIGEIMMTYAPDRLANINRNPITVLRKEGRADIKAHSQSYNGKNYEEYNGMVETITKSVSV